jgi:hypothetical protein
MTTITLFDLVSIFVGVSMVVSVIGVFVVSYIYTEKAESFFPNSEYINMVRGFFVSVGLPGKAFRNITVVLVLLSPNSLARKGFVDLEDVKSFPSGLKRILYVSWGVMTFFLAGTVVLGIYERYKDAMGV